jgi:hypothetical protein
MPATLYTGPNAGRKTPEFPGSRNPVEGSILFIRSTQLNANKRCWSTRGSCPPYRVLYYSGVRPFEPVGLPAPMLRPTGILQSGLPESGLWSTGWM